MLNIDCIWGGGAICSQHRRLRVELIGADQSPAWPRSISLGPPALVRPVQSSNQPFAVPACVRNHPLLGPWPEASLGSGRHGWCPSPSTAQAELNSTELGQAEVWHRHGDRSKNIAADASRLSANRLLKGGWLFHWQKTSLSLQ